MDESSVITEICLGDAVPYFVEVSTRGEVSLTRMLVECRDCPHYDTDCAEILKDGDFHDCDRTFEAVGANGQLLSDCYDFAQKIKVGDYPELSEQDVYNINTLFED